MQACTDALNDWIQCGTPQILKQAHKLGLSVSVPVDEHIGNTVLHVAAQKSSLDVRFQLFSWMIFPVGMLTATYKMREPFFCLPC